MRTIALIAILLVCGATAGGVYFHRAHQRETIERAKDLTGGNPEDGRIAARTLGCVACHVMPNITGPQSTVGPPLEDFGRRSFIAGATDNTPEQLVQFLRDPRSVAPRSAMPKLPMSEKQARDLAAYLYTLR